jgi:hypothetical protein
MGRGVLLKVTPTAGSFDDLADPETPPDMSVAEAATRIPFKNIRAIGVIRG